jgi:lipid-A-disaccharide synthase
LTVQTIQKLKPDVVVTIDAPEFSFRVMKKLHKFSHRPGLIHYVAPTVWAWRPGRAKKIARFLDHLLCLYPFEPPLFEKYGLRSTFVGHPVAHELAQEKKRDPDLLCLLPGSRASEVKTLLPIFGQTVEILHKDFPHLKIVIPTLSSVEKWVQEEVKNWSINVEIIRGDEARRAAFQKASVALAASGTVALQLAAAGLPCVIAYKIGKVSGWIARLLIKVKWACMVNILLRREAIPEFLQKDCISENLAFAVEQLLKDPKMREAQVKAMKQAISLLNAPREAAASVVWEEIKRGK